MALHTAFGFLLIATAVFLVRPQYGIFAFLVGDGAGAVVARRLLPVTITVFWIAGLLSNGARLELYSSRLVASLLVLAAMLVLTVLIRHSTHLLRRLDLARRSVEDELRRNERWLSLAAVRGTESRLRLDSTRTPATVKEKPRARPRTQTAAVLLVAAACRRSPAAETSLPAIPSR